MTARGPGDDHLLRGRVDGPARLVIHGITADLGVVLALDHAGQADIEISVVAIPGVEGDADRQAVDVEQLGRLGDVLGVLDGDQAARAGPVVEVLEDQEAVGPRLGGHAEGLLDGQVGERPARLVGGRRLGRADDLRVVPGGSPRRRPDRIGGDGRRGEHEERGEQRRRPHGWAPGRVEIGGSRGPDGTARGEAHPHRIVEGIITRGRGRRHRRTRSTPGSIPPTRQARLNPAGGRWQSAACPGRRARLPGHAALCHRPPQSLGHCPV